MPFEKGNQHGAKPRLFDQTLRRAITQEDGKRIRECVEKLLDQAAAGEPWAVSLLADRLDGKAAQSLDMHISDARAENLGDDDLLRIAAASRDGTAEAQGGAEATSKLH